MLILQDYHWVWYLLGFIAIPRFTLAILFCLYAPIDTWAKVILILMGILNSGGD